MDALWDDYLQYLIWRCGLQKMSRYSRLFEILHRTKFDFVLERDDNREDDGIELRDDYDIPDDYEEIVIENFFDKDCSVMEMLVGLAIRVDDEFIGDPAEEHPEEFFMEMLENLGLLVYKGNRYREDDVVRILRRWMDREFDRKGVGSPFPLKKRCRDQRKVEIWDQMNAYISENYA